MRIFNDGLQLPSWWTMPISVNFSWRVNPNSLDNWTINCSERLCTIWIICFLCPSFYSLSPSAVLFSCFILFPVTLAVQSFRFHGYLTELQTFWVNRLPVTNKIPTVNQPLCHLVFLSSGPYTTYKYSQLVIETIVGGFFYKCSSRATNLSKSSAIKEFSLIPLPLSWH